MKKKIAITAAILSVLGLSLALFTFVANKKRTLKQSPVSYEVKKLSEEKYPVNSQPPSGDFIKFKPIGVFISTNWNTSTGAPRQGILKPDTKATLQIEKPYRSALRDLERFEYIILLYYFNLTKTWSPVINPPGSGHYFGMFATRSPRRPNPIGFSVVKLDSIDIQKGLLYLSGVDAFKGTPVLDIKPYLPSVDIIESKKNKETEYELGHHDEVFIKDSDMYM
jgi:tRNA-Thr(GGU) m(6)t(6)A37 methyltransferase TsaA